MIQSVVSYYGPCLDVAVLDGDSCSSADSLDLLEDIRDFIADRESLPVFLGELQKGDLP